MGYKVLGERDNKYKPRKGLEGPFYFSDGRVLYYDIKQGQYYDPLTDFYVEPEEMDIIHNHLVKMLTR
jgi:hypothetical protein